MIVMSVVLGACSVGDDADEPILWPAPRSRAHGDRMDAGSIPQTHDRCRPLVGTPSARTEGVLEVRFETTEGLQGQHAPKNVGAAWIEAAGGPYVRTLELWGNERSSITMWDLRRCSTDHSVDSVSSASLDGPAEHNSRWDTRDFRGNVVPDGEYVLWLQVTANEIVPEGPYLEIPFSKHAGGWTLIPDAGDAFEHIELRYTPSQP